MEISKLIYPDLSFKVNGVCFDVHNALGQYANERQYCDAIEVRLKQLGIKYEREKVLNISFEGEALGRNKVDFLIEGSVILEVKAKRFIGREEYYQVQRYLNSANKKLGILVNFRDKRINPKRVLNSKAQE